MGLHRNSSPKSPTSLAQQCHCTSWMGSPNTTVALVIVKGIILSPHLWFSMWNVAHVPFYHIICIYICVITIYYYIYFFPSKITGKSWVSSMLQGCSGFSPLAHRASQVSRRHKKRPAKARRVNRPSRIEPSMSRGDKIPQQFHCSTCPITLW
jgi:hypothetical protein